MTGRAGTLYAALSQLHAEFPDWCFAIRPCWDGPRLEGYRPGCPGGLYAVITADPAELRRELDNAADQHCGQAERFPAAACPGGDLSERPVVPGPGAAIWCTTPAGPHSRYQIRHRQREVHS